MATKSVSFFTVVALGIKLSEAGLLMGQTKLKWHLGQVGPKKFESLVMKQFFLLYLTFWSYLAQVPLKFCLSLQKSGLWLMGTT